MHKLAVVIPFYKLAFFDECLSSLASQTNKEFNVYIGNDASAEDPEMIIRKYTDVLNISYIKFDKNLGQRYLTKHWDRCLDLLKGEEYFILLGDDDRLSENYIQEFYKHLKKIEELSIKVIRFSTQEIDELGKPISKRFEYPAIQMCNDVFKARFFEGSRSSLSELVFAVEQYKKYGFRELPLAWHSDDLAWLEFSEFGAIFTINRATAYFRISSLNISRPAYLMEEKANVQCEFFEIIVNEYLSKFEKPVAKKILLRFELLYYNSKKVNINFWKSNILKFWDYFGILEALKFTRRVFLKGGVNG